MHCAYARAKSADKRNRRDLGQTKDRLGAGAARRFVQNDPVTFQQDSALGGATLVELTPNTTASTTLVSRLPGLRHSGFLRAERTQDGVTQELPRGLLLGETVSLRLESPDAISSHRPEN